MKYRALSGPVVVLALAPAVTPLIIDWQSVLLAVITAATSLGGAYLVYRGTGMQSRAATTAAAQTHSTDSLDRATEAWEKLLTPYREEVERLGRRVADTDDRATRLEQDLANERRERQREAEEYRDRLTAQDERIRRLIDAARAWRNIARTLARHAATLRDEVTRLGGNPDAMPDEMLMLQAGTLPDDDLDDDTTTAAASAAG